MDSVVLRMLFGLLLLLLLRLSSRCRLPLQLSVTSLPPSAKAFPGGGAAARLESPPTPPLLSIVMIPFANT